MQITARFCQHSWQTQQRMPIKQSELGWNEHCAGLCGRAAPVSEWLFFFFSFNEITLDIKQWSVWCRRVWVMLTNQWGDVTISELGLRACDSYKLFILRVWEKKREEMKEERNWESGEKTRKRFLVERREQTRERRVKRRGLSLISNTLLLWSHMGEAGGLCQGETDGLGEWGGALGTGYDV